MIEGRQETGKEGMSESSKKQMHSLRRFADKTFLRRKTTADVDKGQTCSLTANDDEVAAPSLITDVNEESAPLSSTTVPILEPSSTAVSASGSSWPTVSVPRSHIPTPSLSSRRHTCSSQANAIFSPSISPQTKSQIPRSITMRPFDGYPNNVFSGSPTPNQDGRYPFLSTRNQRKSDVGASQRPLWGTHNEELSHHDDTADTVIQSAFNSATFGSATYFDQLETTEDRYLRPTVSWPLSFLTQPDREGDDGDTPTMRQFTNLDEPAGIVDSATLAFHTFANVSPSHSPPGSRYQINSHVMPEESSAWTTELASPDFAMPNYHGYSFDASDQTIGLALTTPPEEDPMYDTAIKAAEPFHFVMPERFNISSEIQDYRFSRSNSEVTEEPGMEVRISPHMDEEGLSALRVSFLSPPPSHLLSHHPAKDKLISSSFLVDQHRPTKRILARPSDCALGQIPYGSNGACLAQYFLHAERNQIRQHA